MSSSEEWGVKRGLTDLVLSRSSSNFVGMESFIRLSSLLADSIRSETKDVRNDVSSFRDLSSSLHSQGDLDVRK